MVGCGQTLDFRNAEVSNNLIYVEGENSPFTGRLTNAPLGVVPVPKVGKLLQLAGQFTGDNSVQGLLLGSVVLGLTSTNSESPVICDVNVDDGRLNGGAECRLNKTGTTIYKFEYEDSTPSGGLEVFSASSEYAGKLLAKATLDEQGVLQGESVIFFPDTGGKAYVGNWKDGEQAGLVRSYSKETEKLVLQATMDAGTFVGEVVQYTPNGETLLRRENWANGQRNGPYEEYDETGRLIKKTTYVDNVDQNMVAESKRLAAELLAAGLTDDAEQASNAILGSLGCIAQQLRDPSSRNKSRAELEDDCNLPTVARVKSQREAEAITAAQEEAIGSMGAPQEVYSEPDTECVDSWIAAYRAEAGEDAVVRHDQSEEWAEWCAKGLRPESD
jgi:hypothetical protein